MKKMILLAMFVSIGAQAKVKMVDFDCSTEDGHQLQFSFKNKLITTPTSDRPKHVDIQFTLDGRIRQWEDAELVNLEVAEGEFGSFFKKDPGQDFFVYHNNQSEVATAEMTVDREHYTFDCQKKVRN